MLSVDEGTDQPKHSKLSFGQESCGWPARLIIVGEAAFDLVLFPPDDRDRYDLYTRWEHV